MTLTLNLPADLTKDLSAEAKQLGLPVAKYALRILAARPSPVRLPETGADLVAYWDLYQDVILTINHPHEGLCAGDVGTLVDRHTVSGKEEGWSVEFFDMTGRTVAVVTAPASHFRLPTSADRPAARTPVSA